MCRHLSPPLGRPLLAEHRDHAQPCERGNERWSSRTVSDESRLSEAAGVIHMDVFLDSVDA